MFVKAVRGGVKGISAVAGTALVLAVACSPVPNSPPARFGNGAGGVAAAAATPSLTPSVTQTGAPAVTPVGFPVAPPPFSEGIFPCSECHSPTDKVNRTPHALEFHDEIQLHHDEKNRWCLDCHDAQHRDQLHLADGRPVKFTESYRLCGQCHGPTLRNWKAGEHGKRTGSWSGEKQYLLCPSCHNPHSPKFKPLEPKHPPMRQELIR